MNLVEYEPEKVYTAWEAEARRECKITPTADFSAQLYGDRTMKEPGVWKGHSVMERVWMMLSALHYDLATRKKPKIALARLCCCMRATSRASHQKGIWAGAWEFTYLPDLQETKGAVSMEEEARLGRYLREKAAIAKSLAESAAAEKA